MGRHVVIYSDDPDKGGVAQYNHRVALALEASGLRVSIVQSRSTGGMVALRESRGIAHWWIPYDTGREFARTLTEAGDAERAFGELRPDLVLFSDCCPVSNMAAKHTAIRLGIPHVVVVHFVAQYLAQRFSGQLRLLAQMYAAARCVVAVSGENLEQLGRLFGLPPGKGRVVFNGVAPKFFQPRSEPNRGDLRRRLGIPEGTVLSLTTARLSAVKLHLLQVAAMEVLAREAPSTRIRCVWAGEGELRQSLESEISRRGLQERFHLVGQISDVEPWYDAADVFTLTSESEGMPLSIMEAMAKGLPVVATAVSGIPEELGREGALLPDPAKDAMGAVTTLARTWIDWSRKPGLREGVGRRCRQRAEALFREETMMRNTLDYIEEAMATAAAV